MDSFALLTDLLPPFAWGRPVFLYGLGIIPLILVWQYFAFRQRPSVVSLVLRGLFLALIILAAAGPYTFGPRQPTPPVLVLDLSQSLTPAQRQWMQQTITQQLKPTPETPLLAFAGNTRRLSWQDAQSILTNPPVALQPEATNIEAVLSHLLQFSEETQPRHVYIFSDGWETHGTATRLLPALAAQNLRLYPLPPPSEEHPANIALHRLSAPQSTLGGESIEIAVALENTATKPAHGELIVREHDTIVWQHSVELRPGTSLFTHSLRLSDTGLVPLHATFTPDPEAGDAVLHDNQATTWVQVAPTEKVLVLSATSRDNRYLKKALISRGLNVTALALGTRPSALPAPDAFAAVILNNVAKDHLPPALIRSLDPYVKNGGGFLMIGGENSLGLGRYAGTPIEKILPVSLVPPQKEDKRTAMLLVIDKSGSMRKQHKLLYAQAGARAVARNLKDTDLFGVIGFDKTPFVVAPLDYLGKTRHQLDDRIGRLKPSGGTLLLPALQEAKRQLERQHATRKHIVVLTDGETGGSGGEYLDLISVMRNELKITLSTIAVGRQPNLRLLSRLADYGGGAFHHTTDPTTLPDLFLDAVSDKPEEKTMVERQLTPIPNRSSPLLKDLATHRLPAVKGYVETKPKKGARVDVSLRDKEKRPPLLASWSYGRGKAIAFTSDANGRWSAPWVRWDRYSQFWNQTVRWSFSQDKKEAPPFSVEVGHDGTGILVEVFFYGEREPDGPTTVTITTPSEAATTFVLERLAPGHYQGAYATTLPGDYTLDVALASGEHLGPLGYSLPALRPREAPQPQPNLALLETLATATGGSLSPDLTSLTAPLGRPAHRPLLPILIPLAMAIYFIELVVRRLTA
jgi:uncharacterized membrane protein